MKEVKIQIKDFSYTVLLVDSSHEELKSEDTNKEILGRTLCLEQKIYVRNGLDPKRTLNVIIHELTHAFIDAYGFCYASFDEEQLCCFNETYSSDIVSMANSILEAFLK